MAPLPLTSGIRRTIWNAVCLSHLLVFVAVSRREIRTLSRQVRVPLAHDFEDVQQEKRSQSYEENFAELLSSFLQNQDLYQRQPSIYYEAGDQAAFRGPEAVRCEPSFTKAPGIQHETQCDKLAILLHGFTACPGLWYSMQPRLKADGFCVLRPTLPGHGYRPVENGMESMTLTIDATTWSKLNEWIEWERFSMKDEKYRFYTGLQVEKYSVGPNCREEDNCYKVIDVKPGKLYDFNTLVAKFEVGGNLDMILPGDIITSIKPHELSDEAAISDTDGELYFSYPLDKKTNHHMDAATFWSSSWSYLKIKIQRKAFEENLYDMPADDTWPVYVDFAKRLALLATAFKGDHPNGTIVMVGHSLGAATATVAMVHAARDPLRPMFDRVLLLNPAYGVDASYGWALKTVGVWFPFEVNDAKCEKTRHTLSTGGYCTFSTAHVAAVNAFGTYALCSLILANNLDDPPFWCKSSFNNVALERARGPISAALELASTYGDPAIDNGRVDIAAKEMITRLGEDRVGFCYLNKELSHSFLDELSSTVKRDFWWNPILNLFIEKFLSVGTKFPANLALKRPECILDKGFNSDMTVWVD